MKFWFLSLCLGFFSIVGYAQESHVSVSVVLNPAGDFKAQTGTVSGAAIQSKDGVVAENITVDVRTLKTGLSLRDKHLKKHLNADKFPFVKLIKASGKDGKGKALIEIAGIQKEVVGTYKIVGSSLNAEFKLHLPDIKITDISYMGVGVEDDVTINVMVPVRAGATAAAAPAPTPATKKKK